MNSPAHNRVSVPFLIPHNRRTHRDAWRQTDFEGRASYVVASLPATVTREEIEPAYVLSKYAWVFRYPGAPCEPDTDEAIAGRSLAEQVRAAIGRRLPGAATL